MRIDDAILSQIKQDISCLDYLEPSQNGLYCCPFCDSGHKKNATGAVKYYRDTNTIFCNACHKKYDVIDLIKNANDCEFTEAVAIGAKLINADISFTGGDTMSIDGKQSLIDWYADKNNIKFTEEYSYCYGKYRDGLTKLKGYDKNGNKTFLWIHADPLQRSGYKTGRGNCPYRLFVAGSLDDQDCPAVFVTEGEKDAITARNLYEDAGIVAVSAHAGATKGKAGNTWKQEYSEQLKGRDIYVFCDNDEPGINFAKIEALELSKVARVVYFMDMAKIWPDCPEKGDISDMVETLGKDKARELCDAYMAEVRPFTEEPPQEDYLSDFLTKIQGRAFEPYKTGLPFFDSLLGGGAQPQSLILLMASPATGKTTLCQQIAETMAKDKKPIVYLNLEMSREQMLAKSIATRIRQKHPESYINATTVLRGYDWDATQRKQIPAEIEAYRQEIFPYLKYNPDDTGYKLEDIKDLLSRLGEEAKATGTQAPAVVLDYLHLVSPDKNIDTQEHLKQVVMTLKEYAINYNTFVIGIVAINRQSKGRITLESGRDSSNIEYTADVILSLEYKAIDNGTIKDSDSDYHTKLAKQQQANPREMILRVLKARFGEVGRSETVYFNAGAGYFYREEITPQVVKAKKRL